MRFTVYILGIICVGLLWTRFVDERDLSRCKLSLSETSDRFSDVQDLLYARDHPIHKE